jgi:uncharacterized RDD family membrane protein YckC
MQTSVPEFPGPVGATPPREWGRAPISAGWAPAPLSVRVLAYVIDLIAIGTIAFVMTVALIALGFLSFGAGWLLIWPVCVATPAIYSGLTLSSPAQATLGMRIFGLSLRQLDGGDIDFLTGAAHALLFYVFGTTMTPFILLIGLFRQDRALLHDIVLRVRLVSAWGG